MKYLDENGLLYLVQKIKTWLNGKSNTGHTHTKSEITDYTEYQLPTASSDTLGGVKVGSGLAINNGVLSATGGGTADSVDWSNVQNKPTKLSEFTNDANFQTDTQVETAITSKGYQTASDVNAIVENVVGAAPEALDTLKELADALGNDANFSATITAELAKKVNTSDLVAITNAEIDTICA